MIPTPQAEARGADPDGRSPFARADVCGLAGFILPLGAPRPVFEDDIWDFTQVIGIPAYVSRCARRLDFTDIDNPRWMMVAKEYVAAQMCPGHEAVRTLPHANRTARAINGLYAELLELVRWFNWLTGQGISGLGEVTGYHCESFAQYRATHRTDGRKTHERRSVRRAVELMIVGLARYGELFTTDRYHPGLRPFRGRAADPDNRRAENKTPPVPDAIFQPMLAAALYLVETLAPPLLRELEAKRRRDARRTTLSRSGVEPAAFREAIRRRVDDRRPFERLTARKPRSWMSEDDPLAAINLVSLAAEAGWGEFRPDILAHVRKELEEAIAIVGVQEPFCRGADPVERADGQGTVPWSGPLSERDLRTLAGVVKTASHLLIVALSGMRQSELREMHVGCRVPPTEVGPGLKRYKLASRVVKGKPLGGVADEWVVVREATRRPRSPRRSWGRARSRAIRCSPHRWTEPDTRPSAGGSTARPGRPWAWPRSRRDASPPGCFAAPSPGRSPTVPAAS